MTVKNKGPLTKVEKFYIDSHKQVPLTELAKDLNRSEEVVTKYYTSQQEVESKPSDSPEATMPHTGDLMQRNEKYGVAAMTKEASMMADEESSAKKAMNLDPSVIHKIKED